MVEYESANNAQTVRLRLSKGDDRTYYCSEDIINTFIYF